MANVLVSYPASTTVGTPVTILLQFQGPDLGGANWNVTFDDNFAGGIFEPDQEYMGDASASGPVSVQTLYTPTETGVVSFGFFDDLGLLNYVYQPTTLLVNPPFEPKKSSAFLGFLE